MKPGFPQRPSLMLILVTCLKRQNTKWQSDYSFTAWHFAAKVKKKGGEEISCSGYYLLKYFFTRLLANMLKNADNVKKNKKAIKYILKINYIFGSRKNNSSIPKFATQQLKHPAKWKLTRE